MVTLYSHRATALLLFINLFWKCSSESFFGYSYVHAPIMDGSGHTDIQLQFSTAQSDGLLLLAAGTTDKCVIELQSGQIKVTLDLGSGPATLRSPPGSAFNDLRWHSIHLRRSLDRVVLSVDSIFTNEKSTQGDLHELNINRGVFVGGVNAFVGSGEGYMGNFQEFRGCIRDVQYNNIDVFHAAREKGSDYVFGVQPNCSREFAATSDQAISFMYNKSFVAFPPPESIRHGRFNFNLRTRATHALLVYSAGRFGDADFIAIEIISGSIKLTVDKGSGKAELLSDQFISDGVEHSVEIIVQPVSLHVRVDGHQTAEILHHHNSLLDLDSLLYVGGLGVRVRIHAAQKRLQSLDGANAAAGSFIGCIERFRFNSQQLGFRQVVVSEGVEPDCMWSYPCASDPCIENATCIEEGFKYFSCNCNQDTCIKPGSVSVVQTPSASAMVHVQDLALREGTTAHITNSNIHLLVDHTQYNIANTSVVFRVQERPQHGFLSVGLASNSSNHAFTLADLGAELVTYTHDGSETTSDRMVLRLRFSNVPDRAPSMFKKQYSITLMVIIAPWNDKPVILLPENNILRIVENTKIKVSPSILSVRDPDDIPTNLQYTIQYPHESVTSYFEVLQIYGRKARVEMFTEQNILDGHVDFVHRGPRNQSIKIEVSDRKDWSGFVLLNIIAEPLQLHLNVCSGMEITPGATRLITNTSLAFTSNAPYKNYFIKYSIFGFLYGNIEKRHNSGRWRAVSEFNQHDINNNAIRYTHNEAFGNFIVLPIWFKVSIDDVETKRYQFDITMVIPRVTLDVNNRLELDGVSEQTITPSVLKASSSVSYHTDDDIVYHVTNLPRHGDLLRVKPGRRRPRKEIISVDTNFTQGEIAQGIIHYRLKRKESSIRDDFRFNLLIPDVESEEHTFYIEYSPGEGVLSVVNRMLNVMEGEKKVIRETNLNVRQAGVEDFLLTVTRGPNHGVLQLIDPRTADPIARNVSEFTNSEITMGKLYYYHDDSESDYDEFSFVATPLWGSRVNPDIEAEIVSEIFEINITLSNDNLPVRVINKPFDVEPNQGRPLTLADLRFTDEDINQDIGLLQYKRKRTTNAQIVLASDHSEEVQFFRQAQLANGEIFARHRGQNNRGRIDFEITDGQYTVDFVLHVRAYEAYVRLNANTGITVMKGLSSIITTHNLSAITNKQVNADQIKFLITQPPSFGTIFRDGFNRSRFTMQDLKENSIVYQHDGSEVEADNFHFRYFLAKTSISGDANVDVQIIPREGLVSVRSNRKAHVFPNASFVFTRDLLYVTYPNSPTSVTVFTLLTHPRHGALILEGRRRHRVNKFTQLDIDEGRLQYHNTDRSTRIDKFDLSVTNGIDYPLEMTFKIALLPDVIPIQTKGFSVLRNSRVIIGMDIINVTNDYLHSQTTLVFTVLDPPRNGDLEMHEMTAIHFNQGNLKANQVVYIHDGSSATSDEFTIRAHFNDTNSDLHTIHISVESDTKQPPVIIDTNKLVVWSGSKTPITRYNLLAADNDTDPEDLHYTVTQPNNGYFCMATDDTRRVIGFSQADINANRVLFVHTGAISSAVSLVVSDGTHTTPTATMRISADSLSLDLYTIQTLHAFPRVKQPITQQQLLAKTNDVDKTHPITFVITNPPSEGTIYRNQSGVLHNISQFDQSDIDAGIILYEFNSSLSPRAWKAVDSFSFDVKTLYAISIVDESFRIEISYLNINAENVRDLVNIGEMMVSEGSSSNITEKQLDITPLRRKLVDGGRRGLDITYVLTKLPMHGVLQFNGVKVTDTESTFRQSDLTQRRLVYVHDHSDTFWDSFHWTLELSTSPNSGEIRRADHIEVFNITIEPVNDQNFELQKSFPSIRLVQGFNATITRRNLSTVDADTPDSEIIYEVENPPVNGHLVNTDNPSEKIQRFTQQDINDGKIVFVHNGLMEQGAFYFMTWDGHHKPIYRTFSIQVTELTLRLQGKVEISILQGHMNTRLKADDFTIDTNGRTEDIIFNITKHPSYGDFFKGTQKLDYFSYVELAADEPGLYYIQSDLSQDTDYFEFTLSNDIVMTRILQAYIRVVPQIIQTSEPFQIHGTTDTTIPLSALNATALARTTGDNPRFTVVAAPIHGVLDVFRSVFWRAKRDAKKNRGGGGQRRKEGANDLSEVFLNFTHEDVIDELVYYQPYPLTSGAPVYDNFTYVVSAMNSQPVQMTFPIMVIPVGFTTPSTTEREILTSTTITEEPMNTPPRIKENLPKTARHISRSHLMIVGSVCAITFVVVVALISVKCIKVRRRHRRRKYAMAVMQEDTKPPLDMGLPGLTYDDLSMSKTRPDKAIPIINVTSDSDVASVESMGSRSTARSRSSGKHSYNSHPGQYACPSPTPPDVTHTDLPARSTPACKVTPISEDDDEESTSGGKHEQITFDWENVDPELLQHCRTTNPVLHSNKYWV